MYSTIQSLFQVTYVHVRWLAIFDEGVLVAKFVDARSFVFDPTFFPHCRIRGRCYAHIFLRFSTIFCKKIGVFLKNQCYDQLFSKFSFVLSQKRRFFRWIFRRKYLKNHNIGPRYVTMCMKRLIFMDYMHMCVYCPLKISIWQSNH
jgi:hypothetical protein